MMLILHRWLMLNFWKASRRSYLRIDYHVLNSANRIFCVWFSNLFSISSFTYNNDNSWKRFQHSIFTPPRANSVVAKTNPASVTHANDLLDVLLCRNHTTIVRFRVNKVGQCCIWFWIVDILWLVYTISTTKFHWRSKATMDTEYGSKVANCHGRD